MIEKERINALAGPLTQDASTGILSVEKQAGADDAIITPQWSFDLTDWQNDGFQYLGADPLRWIEDEEGSRKFYRLLIEGR